MVNGKVGVHHRLLQRSEEFQIGQPWQLQSLGRVGSPFVSEQIVNRMLIQHLLGCSMEKEYPILVLTNTSRKYVRKTLAL